MNLALVGDHGIGGEEFAMLLPETSGDDARLMLARIRNAIALLAIPRIFRAPTPL